MNYEPRMKAGPLRNGWENADTAPFPTLPLIWGFFVGMFMADIYDTISR